MRLKIPEPILCRGTEDCSRCYISIHRYISLFILSPSFLNRFSVCVFFQFSLFLNIIFSQFPLYPEYEYHPPPQPRIPYQQAYTTDEERSDARSRDLRAQRAWWRTNLTLLETKKRILEGKRIDLERGLKSELKKALESQSDLGVGYTNYHFRH